ncbi:MAG: hypothetical protein IPH21_15890 [Flavobacteriales bacterium]|nr:hypothetical protein [Flavobacteriales bacterium]
MRTHMFLIAFGVGLNTWAQVQVDNSFLLNGSTQADRQLNGLAPTTDADRALSAAVEQSGALRSVVGVTGSNWQIPASVIAGPLQPGTHFVIAAPTNAIDPISISVASGGTYSVLWRPGQAFLATDIEEGMMLSTVFDGTAFQVLNGRSSKLRECPTDMVEIGTQYCIDPTQQGGSTDFFDAALSCASAGKRLCTWAEFMTACQDAAVLGLSSASNDYEWMDDSANEALNVRLARLANCEFPSTRPVSGPAAPSRCCYTR